MEVTENSLDPKGWKMRISFWRGFRQMCWACDHVAEMLNILATWLIEVKSPTPLPARRPARRFGEYCLNCGSAHVPLAHNSNSILPNVARDVARDVVRLITLSERSFRYDRPQKRGTFFIGRNLWREPSVSSRVSDTLGQRPRWSG